MLPTANAEPRSTYSFFIVCIKTNYGNNKQINEA
jgi:hypothetical protein